MERISESNNTKKTTNTLSLLCNVLTVEASGRTSELPFLLLTSDIVHIQVVKLIVHNLLRYLV